MLEDTVRTLLEEIGEDPNREGLVQTPRRVAEAYRFLTKGYSTDPKVVLNNAVFEEQVDEMITVRDIELYSLCEHHLLPFHGHAHIAYIPSGRIVGLSKLPRLLEVFSRRLQVQERLTRQVAEAIDEVLRPRGVAVMLEAQHFCMMMRGVAKQDSSTVTTYLLGEFRDFSAPREEFFRSVGCTTHR